MAVIICGIGYFFAVLFDAGMRIGEALGLRHEDIAAAESQITVRSRFK